MFAQTIQVNISPDELTHLIETAIQKRLDSWQPPKLEGADFPELLTRKETAKLLRISLVSLHAWSTDTPDRKAILKPHRVNGRVRFRRSEVLDVVKAHQRFKS